MSALDFRLADQPRHLQLAPAQTNGFGFQSERSRGRSTGAVSRVVVRSTAGTRTAIHTLSPFYRRQAMRALCFHGRHDVRCDNVPDPIIKDPGDVVVKITSTAICGSD